MSCCRRAAGGDERFECTAHGWSIGDISRKKLRVPAHGADPFGDALGLCLAVAVAHHDIEAICRQTESDRSANAAAGAGDESVHAGER